MTVWLALLEVGDQPECVVQEQQTHEGPARSS